MNANQLTIKCYAEHKEGAWSAICLDFNIAAQADTFEESKEKLEGMIADYLYDIFEGEDKAFASQLLNRRAHWSFWLRYYYLDFINNIYHKANNVRCNANRIFNETMPIRLA